jgi:hypothetical protein
MISLKDFLIKIEVILNRPAMFNVQKIEDVNIIFFSEIFINNNTYLEKWNVEFSEFVKKEMGDMLNNFGWSKIIRLYSGSDAHSLELFKELLVKFGNISAGECLSN